MSTISLFPPFFSPEFCDMNIHYEKVHSLDLQDVMHTIGQESKSFMNIAEYEGQEKALKQLSSVQCHFKKQ